MLYEMSVKKQFSEFGQVRVRPVSYRCSKRGSYVAYALTASAVGMARSRTLHRCVVAASQSSLHPLTFLFSQTYSSRELASSSPQDRSLTCIAFSAGMTYYLLIAPRLNGTNARQHQVVESPLRRLAIQSFQTNFLSLCIQTTSLVLMVMKITTFHCSLSVSLAAS